MRKLAALCLCFCMLIGCGKGTVNTTLLQFSCDVEGEYNGLLFTGTIRRGAMRELTMTLITPPSLAGVQFICEGEKTSIRLGELSYTKEASLLEKSVPRLLTLALDDLFSSLGERASLNKEMRVFSKIAGYEYTALFDENTGFLLSLEFTDTALTVRFANVQKIAQGDALSEKR